MEFKENEILPIFLRLGHFEIDHKVKDRQKRIIKSKAYQTTSYLKMKCNKPIIF